MAKTKSVIILESYSRKENQTGKFRWLWTGIAEDQICILWQNTETLQLIFTDNDRRAGYHIIRLKRATRRRIIGWAAAEKF